jgi:hypothetical protein
MSTPISASDRDLRGQIARQLVARAFPDRVG